MPVACQKEFLAIFVAKSARCEVPGSARVSRAGFGVPPKRTSLRALDQTARGFEFGRFEKVRDSETLSPAPETGALPGTRCGVQF